MSTDKSSGYAFAPGVITDGYGKFSGLSRTAAEFGGGDVFLNDDRLNEKCLIEAGTNSARSGVEITVWAVETFKQCIKVSSDDSQLKMNMRFEHYQPDLED
jgi:hypothetical protein